MVKGLYDKIVIMGRGDLEVALTVKAHRFTAGAESKIKAAGGSAEVLG